MRNRRIMNGYFTDDGVSAAPAIESDTVSGLYSHLPGDHWSTVISHAWLHMFGVPDGMRVVPLKGPAHGPRVGLVIAARSPEPVLARALLDVARQAGVHNALDELLDVHLMGSGDSTELAVDRCRLSRHSEQALTWATCHREAEGDGNTFRTRS